MVSEAEMVWTASAPDTRPALGVRGHPSLLILDWSVPWNDMIRVIYRWHVESDRYGEFVQWWHDGTLRIRSDYSGAMGSTLCSGSSSNETVIAIARWRSQADLERFWRNPGGSVFPWAEMESVELLEEIDHLTVEG
jgi:hypothetical protein